MGLYTKLADRYVAVAVGSAVEGGTYYKVVTETVEGVEYAVLDYNKLPTGKNFPVGWIAYDEYEFGWEGGAVDVNFEYQWGFSAIHESTISVPVKGYEINPAKISNFAKTENADVADTIKNFTSFDAFKDLDSILANPAYNNSLAEYIKEFKYVNGKYTSGSYTNLSVEWDLTNLEKRLAEIKNGDSYDYYKGIDVVVTAKVGANVFRYVTGYDEDGEPIYGFAGEAQLEQTAQWHKSSQSPSRLQAECLNHLPTMHLSLMHTQAMQSQAMHLQQTSRCSLQDQKRQWSSTATHLQSQHLSSLRVANMSKLIPSPTITSHILVTRAKSSMQDLKSAQQRAENKLFTFQSM
jgi:hypothetical protein